jgi:hypothetical protein
MIRSEVEEIINKVLDGDFLTRKEIESLLGVDPHSTNAGLIMTAANSITRSSSLGNAEVHAQIGLRPPKEEECT